MKKKLILLFSLALIIIAAAPAQAIQMATVINLETGHRKAVVVNDPNAFDDGYYLEVAYGYTPQADSDLLGYSVVTDYQTTLSSSMTATQTTLPVSKVTTKDNHTLTMGDLGSKVFFVIEPGSRKEEIVMATGISGTTWTNLVRGLAFYGTSTVSVAANRYTHNSGSTVVMSNVHYATDESVDKDSNETIAGLKTFSTLPQIGTYAAPTDDKEFSPKKYVDDVISAGAPDATLTVKGLLEVATGAEIASTTPIGGGGTSAPLALTTGYATSSPDVRGIYIPVSENDGYLNQDWLDLSENFAHTGEDSFSSLTLASTTATGKFEANRTMTAIIDNAIDGSATPQLVAYNTDSGYVVEAIIGTTILPIALPLKVDVALKVLSLENVPLPL